MRSTHPPATRSFRLPALALAALVGAPLASAGAAPNFKAETIDDEIKIGYGLAIGDVDGDGKPDILLADKKEFVWYRNPDWKRFVMAENLTKRDNVCLAARDINGDGKVEVAVGAQWNPGNTSDPAESGSVHYLIRPEDPTAKWEAVQLHHEPTVHRMRWVKRRNGDYRLIVVPLHGRGNKGGQGAGVRVLAYRMPEGDPRGGWTTELVDDQLHVTHNFDLVADPRSGDEGVLLGGREGIKYHLIGLRRKTGGRVFRERDLTINSDLIAGTTPGPGEVRFGRRGEDGYFVAAVEPFHGDNLVVYEVSGANDPHPFTRHVLDDTLAAGHALACADLLGTGEDQIVVGWRNVNKDRKVGIKLFARSGASGRWAGHLVDDNQMACEDLRVGDLDGDGKPEIVAAGRMTHNLVVYWNKRGG